MKDNVEERKRFVAVMKALMVNSSVNIVDPEERRGVYDFYFRTLCDLSIEEFEAAAKGVLKTWTFTRMPPIAEILKHVPGQIQIEDQANVQATHIIETLRLCGSDCEPVWEDPITKKIMASRWTYREWGRTIKEDDLKWWRKEFIELYHSFSESEQIKQIQSNIGDPRFIEQKGE